MTPDKTKDIPTRPNTPPLEPVDNLISALIGLGIDISPLYNGQYGQYTVPFSVNWPLNMSYF